jgi:hypothetical protein
MFDEPIDYTDVVNDLLEAVAEVFPEAYQKSKEAIFRRSFESILKEYFE